MAEIARYKLDLEHPVHRHWCEILPTDAVPRFRFESSDDEALIRSRVAAYNDGSLLTPEAAETKLCEITAAAGIDLTEFRRSRAA